MIVLNLKAYPSVVENPMPFVETAKDVASECGIRISVAVPQVHLRQAAREYRHVFAQHVDSNAPGAFTGSVPAEAIAACKASGSLLNHSEKKVPFEKISSALERMNALGLETVICAESQEEVLKIGRLSCKYIAIEPPELIGSGISVSTAKPEAIKNAVDTIATISVDMGVLCGAGISTGADVKKSVELGAKGVLLASAYVNAKNREAFLKDLCSGFR
jgi:triosephosphate isomerase (TIM)